MTERALATIRKISEVKPIPNADAIEAVRVHDVSFKAISNKWLLKGGE
jgi:hypothetical protein